jgi:hypothetical protein
MGDRRCRYCQKSFPPSKFQPRQAVCSEAVCQRKRRAEYHRRKIAVDPEYREVTRDSPRKWRTRNPDYWKRYRKEHPKAVERNRQQQKLRDRRQRLRNLANNTSALDLKHSAAAVWLVGAGAEYLASVYRPIPRVGGWQEPAAVALFFSSLPSKGGWRLGPGITRMVNRPPEAPSPRRDSLYPAGRWQPGGGIRRRRDRAAVPRLSDRIDHRPWTQTQTSAR